LSRGDRSRQGRERTEEERERDRQERARRRAARSGQAPATAVPDETPAAPALSDAAPDEAPAAPELSDAAPELSDAAPDVTPAAPELSDAALDVTPADAIDGELDAPVPYEPDAEMHAAGVHPEHEPPSAADLAVPPAPEPLAPDAEASALENAHLEQPTAAWEIAAEEQHAAFVSAEAHPGTSWPPAEHAGASAPAPPEEPPVSPPPFAPRSARGRRRPRTSADIAPAGRRRRPTTARLGAVLALAAAIAAVVLLLSALLGGKSSKPVATATIVKVVIPEGKTRMEIAGIASRAGLRGSYRAASKRSPLLNPSHYGAPPGTPDLEGFLFPATYDEYGGAPVSRLVSEQLIAFKENFGAEMTARARALHITPYQLLIVASMVEREAQVAGDRAKIAAVIYNRLHRGIPLGIDATIYYAVELEKNVATYTQELSEAQLHINSPYNTRLHTGLPPTPISNPGLASIEAAANPAHVPYLYYVAGADGCGEQVFSTTLAAFEANVAAYQAAVKKNGGRPPTCTKK